MSQLTVFSIITFLHFISWHLVSPYIALVAKGQGAGTDTIGLIMAAYAALPMIFAVPTGIICDRAGTRKVFITSTVGIAGVACMLLISRSISFLAVSLAALGLFHVLQSVSTQVTIANGADDNVLYREFAVYSFCACVGQLVGPPLGGILVKNFGYNTLFAVSASLALLMVPFAPLTREAGSRQSTSGPSNGRSLLLGKLEILIRRPSFIISLLGIFGIMALYSMRTSFYSVYFDEISLDAPMIGILLTVQAAAETAIRPLTVSWRSKYGTALPLLVALGACAASALFTPWFKSPGLLALILGLGGMGYGMVQPISMALASQAGGDGERGLAMGMRMFANRLSGLAAPLFLGRIGNIFGIKTIFVATSVTIMSCLVIVYFLARKDSSLWLTKSRAPSGRAKAAGR